MTHFKVTQGLSEEEIQNQNSLKELVCLLHFEPNLLVQKDCIGEEIQFRFMGMDCTAYLPRFPKSFPGDCGILIPPKKSRLKKVYWGQVLISPIGNSRVNSFILTMDAKGVKTDAGEILNALDQWHKLLVDNISLISGINVRLKPKSIVSAPIGMNRFELYNNGKRLNAYRTADMSVTIALAPYGIDFKSLSEAIMVTSQMKRHVLEYYFLLDAWEAFMLNNYRKCVLDSATAVEIALNNALKNVLPVDDGFKDTVLSKYDSFRSKRVLCKELNIALPKHRYDVEFDKIRNKAIHVGYNPSEGEAKKILEITESLLNSVVVNRYEK